MQINQYSAKMFEGDAVEEVWGDVECLVQKFAEWGRGEFQTEDVLSEIRAKHMQLWVYYEGSEILLICVTQILQFPRRKICNFYGVAGRKMHRMWQLFSSYGLNWLRVNGIEEIQTTCRDEIAEKIQTMGFTKLVNVMRFDPEIYERMRDEQEQTAT